MARKILFACICLYGNTANVFLDPDITIDSIVAPEPGYPVTVLTKDQGRTCNFAVNHLEAWHKAVDDRPISWHPFALPSNDLIFFWITVTAARAYLNRKYTLTALRNEITFLPACPCSCGASICDSIHPRGQDGHIKSHNAMVLRG